MRRTFVVITLVALALVVAGTAGCQLFDSPLQHANDAIEEGNVHLRAYYDSEDRLQVSATELNSINATSVADATKALDLIAKIKTELDTQTGELEAGAVAIAKVKDFDVDESYKKYADLEVKAIRAQIDLVKAGQEYYAEMERHYVAIRDGKTTQALTAEILKNMETQSQRITELSKIASDAKDAADLQFDITSQEK